MAKCDWSPPSHALYSYNPPLATLGCLCLRSCLPDHVPRCKSKILCSVSRTGRRLNRRYNPGDTDLAAHATVRPDPCAHCRGLTASHRRVTNTRWPSHVTSTQAPPSRARPSVMSPLSSSAKPPQTRSSQALGSTADYVPPPSQTAAFSETHGASTPPRVSRSRVPSALDRSNTRWNPTHRSARCSPRPQPLHRPQPPAPSHPSRRHRYQRESPPSEPETPTSHAASCRPAHSTPDPFQTHEAVAHPPRSCDELRSPVA
jgi:hypothetical protein